MPPRTKEECCKYLRPRCYGSTQRKMEDPSYCRSLTGPRRFNELKGEIEGISAKMLSKELQELEVNELVWREIHETMPVTVEYSISGYGETLEDIIIEMSQWEQEHRNRIMGS